MSVPSIKDSGDYIIFSNAYITYKIDKSNSKSASIEVSAIDSGVASGNLISSPFPFARCRLGASSWVESSGAVRFEPDPFFHTTQGTLVINVVGIELSIKCEAHRNHVMFELVGIHDPRVAPAEAIEAVSICRMRINSTGTGYVGTIFSDRHIVTELPLTPETAVVLPNQVVEARSYSAIGEMRPKVALFGCTNDPSVWMNNVEALELQYGLPHPTIDGVWVKRHPDVKTSYLFVDLKEESVDAIIDYAIRGNFKYILARAKSVWQSNGSYLINTENFPHGVASLRSVVSKLHGWGLKFGLHTLSFWIGKNDPYVTPNPDPRIAKDDPPLILDTGASAVSIPISSPPIPDFPYPNEKDVLIDNEIVKYSGVNIRDNAFIVSRRGAYGTVAASHSAGANVYHLPNALNGNAYLPSLTSDLVDEIAGRLAKQYRDLGADFVYLDGVVGLSRFWPDEKWYGSQFSTSKFFDALSGNLLLESSSPSSQYGWHAQARAVSADFAAIGVESFMDEQRLRHLKRVFANSFLQQELGWIGLLAKVDTNNSVNLSFASTTLDEMEYQLNRSLAYDMPIGLETTKDELEANGLSKDILDLIGTYENLRLRGYFSDAALNQLKLPEDRDPPEESFSGVYGLSKDQYRLVRSWCGAYGFVHQAYVEHVVENPSGETWIFKNPFPDQPLKVKVTALPAHSDFSDVENIPLLTDPTEVTVSNSPPDTRADTSCRVDPASGEIVASYASTGEYGWCTLSKDFVAPTDLSNHKAIAVEVAGDNKGEVISIKLTDKSGMHRVHQFTIDFDDGGSFRQIILPLPSTRTLYENRPHESYKSLRFFDYSRVTRLSIIVTRITSVEVSFSIRSIKALKQSYPEMKTPALSINGRTLILPVHLDPRSQDLNSEPWEYVEFDGKRYTKRNGNHHSKADWWIRNRISGVPTVRAGKNIISYRHQGQNKAIVRILMEAPPVYYGHCCPLRLFAEWFDTLFHRIRNRFKRLFC